MSTRNKEVFNNKEYVPVNRNRIYVRFLFSKQHSGLLLFAVAEMLEHNSHNRVVSFIENIFIE